MSYQLRKKHGMKNPISLHGSTSTDLETAIRYID